MVFQVVIQKDKYGYFAYCPELPGCHTQGDTFDEVVKNIKEAIELYLETLTEDELEELRGRELITAFVEV
ncbi:MAG: type II toxin-antitoxin system HicB family antitoxin [Aquificaceae bacterium]|uniref:type II toxin-antitoxin system HicB family antitoxin n=1 Tax=Pampinifervens diazotrophicum TaxID=1632018 RepID=UPI002B256666|nr:type II toxin-antitoxin system HicB family antitoxin [Hydrogenobacter sp. T-2]WPM32534.1 type II toxin-antitoxin system HicB family antitoxin [Hydrogenobacter sp. T-2]